jgi:hypothetical protein
MSRNLQITDYKVKISVISFQNENELRCVSTEYAMLGIYLGGGTLRNSLDSTDMKLYEKPFKV